MLPILGGESLRHDPEQKRISHDGAQIPDIKERLDQWYGAHGPVAAQVARKDQQPKIDADQIVVG